MVAAVVSGDCYSRVAAVTTTSGSSMAEACAWAVPVGVAAWGLCGVGVTDGAVLLAPALAGVGLAAGECPFSDGTGKDWA